MVVRHLTKATHTRLDQVLQHKGPVRLIAGINSPVDLQVKSSAEQMQECHSYLVQVSFAETRADFKSFNKNSSEPDVHSVQWGEDTSTYCLRSCLQIINL